jgi:hypothetical protein
MHTPLTTWTNLPEHDNAMEMYNNFKWVDILSVICLRLRTFFCNLFVTNGQGESGFYVTSLTNTSSIENKRAQCGAESSILMISTHSAKNHITGTETLLESEWCEHLSH